MKYAMCPKCGRRLCKGENGTKVEMECPKCGEFASVIIEEDDIHISKKPIFTTTQDKQLSSFMGYLKGKSTMIIFERYAKLKYKYGNRHFWSRGYYVSTVGGNKQAVQKYIQNQEKEDLISAQISMVEYYDPFKEWLESNLSKKDKPKKK